MQDRLFIAAADINGEADVRRLVQEEKVNINAEDSATGKRAVEFAAETGSLGTLKFLIEEAHADLTVKIPDDEPRGLSVLYWAAVGNQANAIDYLFEWLKASTPAPVLWTDITNGHVVRGNRFYTASQFAETVECFQTAIMFVEKRMNYYKKLVWDDSALEINEKNAIYMAELYLAVAKIQCESLQQFKEARDSVSLASRLLEKINHVSVVTQEQACSTLLDKISLAWRQAEAAAEAKAPERGFFSMRDDARLSFMVGKERYSKLRVDTGKATGSSPMKW